MTLDTQSPMMEAAEIAGLLGWSPRWFALQKKILMAEHGMPAQLPGRRWSRVAVMRWLETYGQAKAQARSEDAASFRVAYDRKVLAEKYVGSNAA